MNNISKFLEYISECMYFVIALTYSVIMINTYNDLFESQKNVIINNTLFESLYDVEEDIISSSTLIATLFYEVDYDIQIDDLLISKTENTASYISSFVYDANYKRSYVYSDDGVITRVVYTKLDQG